MSTTPIEEKLPQPLATNDLDIPLPPTDLPYDDGEPLETKRHRIAMNTLIRSLDHAWSNRNDYFAGGNMFVYFSTEQVRNQDFRGPDFFVVLNIDGSYSRKTWTVWEEGGRYPNVIVELLSASTSQIDLGAKKNLYEQVFRTPDYFVFDPYDPNSLQAWRLDGNLHYQSLMPNDRGWLWSQSLGLWLGTWEGTIERETAIWLRLYNDRGQLILLPEEAAQQQAAQAQQQAAQAQQQAAQAQQQLTEAQQQLSQEQQRIQELEATLVQYRQRLGETIE